MKYQIVAERTPESKIIFLSGLTYTEATKNLVMITQMIKAGIKTQYDVQDFSIVEEK